VYSVSRNVAIIGGQLDSYGTEPNEVRLEHRLWSHEFPGRTDSVLSVFIFSLQDLMGAGFPLFGAPLAPAGTASSRRRVVPFSFHPRVPLQITRRPMQGGRPSGIPIDFDVGTAKPSNCSIIMTFKPRLPVLNQFVPMFAKEIFPDEGDRTGG